MHRITTLFFATLLAANAANPFGLFDFNLRGKTPAEQIHSLDGIGFDGITLPLNAPKDLVKLEAYQKAKPDLKVFAALIHLDADKPEAISRPHLQAVAKKLATLDAKLWLIIGGTKGADDKIQAVINEVADIAAAEKVGVSLYPHDNTAVETAEEALVYLKKANRPNITLSVHLCHEMRGGNTERLAEVVAAVRPHMDLVTLSGSDRKVNDNSKDWSDAIKPLGEGDFDPRVFLRILKKTDFQGPIILHTFGLMKKPDSHYQTSFTLYQKMRSEVDAEAP
jgi:sugar phosphate isomerase/epimerase